MDIGETVGNYRLLSVLGRGGMGVVYRAEHLLLGRVAALKVLLPEFSANQDVVTRFFNEAKAATLIHHPGIVQIWDYGQHHDGSAYLVMELVDGTSLAAHLRAVGKLTQDQAIPIAIDIAAALAAAHAAGIVHRDLKPDNIILVDDPAKAATRTKILDFGIAKLGADLLGGSLRTRTGSLLGTPMYMAPEQCRGASDLDSRADIYSLSCIVFEMLTGQPPFARGALAEILAAHLYEEPPSIRASNPEIAVELDTLIRSGMAKAAEARPPAMTALELQLRATLVGRPGLTTTRGRRRSSSWRHRGARRAGHLPPVRSG
jgi:eukaryotic-like serine/threonine-protein kinase